MEAADNIGGMYTTPVRQADEPEHVARFLTDPLGQIWRGLDRGRAAASEFFEPERRSHEPYLWAHIVRYEAALFLATVAQDRAWHLSVLKHSGIKVSMEPFTIHICKAMQDGPQSPGRNRSRREYVCQVNRDFWGEDAANLVLYWRLAGDDLRLGLCKPCGTWKYGSAPELEWRRPIVFDPIAGLTFPTADEDDDLHVQLRFQPDPLDEEEQDG